MHDVEREIIKATKYKVARKYDDRQDYLRSVFLSTQHLTDDDFDNLTDEAAAWANACVEAQNRSKDEDLPDFDEVAPEDADEEIDEDEDEDEAEEAETKPDDPDEDDESEDDADSDENEEADDDENKEASEVDEPDETDDTENEEEAEPEPVKKPKRTAKPKPKVKAKVEKVDPRIPPKESNKQKVERHEKRYRDGDVELDKFGCIIGSKNHKALVMFEKGATTSEVKRALGGTYYNLLGKLKDQGHKVLKEGSIITLIHKSKVKVSSPKKSKK